jgi:hypothetical protein
VVEGFCPLGAVKHCEKICSGIAKSTSKNLMVEIRFFFIGDFFDINKKIVF